jgi:hypothetical protein
VNRDDRVIAAAVEAAGQQNASLRFAQVVSVAAGSEGGYLVTVSLDGVTVGGIPCAGALAPVVGAGVWLLQQGSMMVAFASLTPDATYIAPDTIDASMLAPGSVETAAIAANAVAVGQIAAGAVNAAALADNSVQTAKIANGAIAAGKIAAGAVDATAIANGAVGSAKIADAAIVSAKIATAAIGTAQIADAAINNAKIASLDAGKITTGSLDANRIAADTITASHIAAGAITAAEIAAGAITAGAIAAGAITAGKIAANSITGDRIVAGSITATLLAADALYGKALDVGGTGLTDSRLQVSTAGVLTLNSWTSGEAIKVRTGQSDATRLGLTPQGVYFTGPTGGGTREVLATGDLDLVIGSQLANAVIRAGGQDVAAFGGSYVSLLKPTSAGALTVTGNLNLDGLVYGGGLTGSPGGYTYRYIVQRTSDLRIYYGATVASSEAVKRDIEVLDSAAAVATLRQVAPVTYRYREGLGVDSDTTRAGFTAERLEAAGLPSFVERDDEGHPVDVDFRQLTAILWAVVRDQQNRIDRLEAREATR